MVHSPAWRWLWGWLTCHLGLLLGTLAAVEPAADLYVSTAGNDDHPGTAEKPLATLGQAQKRVRQLLTEKPRSLKVLVRGGVYRLSEPLVFTPADSAAAGFTVSYAAFPGESPVFSGGREIRNWKAQGPVWQTEIPEARAAAWPFVDLYVGHERRPRARTPNAAFLRVEQAGADKRTSFTFRAGDLPTWAPANEAELVFLHDWSTSRVGIARVDAGQRQLFFTHPIGPHAAHYAMDHFEAHPRYFLEGARAFLDAPGEWHLDRASGVLTYAPRAGEALESFVAIAPNLENLISLRGDEEAGKPVTGLRFEGLAWAHAGWLPPALGFAGMQAGFFEDRANEAPGRVRKTSMAAAVKFDFASDCAISNCRIEHCGGAGAWLERRCRDCTISGCTVNDLGGNGLMVGETASRPAELLTQNIALTRNTVRRCGQRYFGAVGVWLGLVAHCQVERCEVSDLPYTGISLGWSWNESPTSCRANTIRANHIHHCLQVLADGGGIYTLGQQPLTVLADNHIHDIPPTAGRAESNGMFLDEGSSEFLVERNTLYNIANSPIRFHRAARLTLRDNRLVSPPGVPALRYNNADPKTMILEHNQEIVAERWSLPAQDAAAAAGP